jgi:hypothetical protein
MSDKGLKIHVDKSHKDLRKEKKPDSVEIKKLDHSRDFACAQPRNGNVLFSQDFYLSFYIMSIYLAYISFLAYILFRSAVGHFIFVYFVILLNILLDRKSSECVTKKYTAPNITPPESESESDSLFEDSNVSWLA